MVTRNILNVLTDAFDMIDAKESDFLVEHSVHEQTLRITIVLRRPEGLPRAVVFHNHRLVFVVSREGDVFVEINELLSRSGLHAFLAVFIDSIVDF